MYVQYQVKSYAAVIVQLMMVEVTGTILLDVAPELLPGVQEVQPVHRHLGTPFLFIHANIILKQLFYIHNFPLLKVTLFLQLHLENNLYRPSRTYSPFLVFSVSQFKFIKKSCASRKLNAARRLLSVQFTHFLECVLSFA